MKKVMKVLFVLNLLCLVIFLCSCEQKTASNGSAKETSTLNADALVHEASKNNSPMEYEIGNIIFEVPGYYNQKVTGAEYCGLPLDAYYGRDKSSDFIGFSSFDGTNTKLIKSNKANIIKSLESVMDVVTKTEDTMVGNNYVIKIMGLNDEATLVWEILVNDSANKGTYVIFATRESEKSYFYNDFIKMIDNAVFKVDDLELVGGIKGTTTRSDGYGFSSYISGVIKNNTDKKYSYVQITFALFDKDGNKVGTALANVNSLDAGETWKFEAIALKDFSTYKLDEITGW